MKRRMVTTIVGGLLVSLVLANPAAATIRYVWAGATGSGTSWSNPTGSLQAAINASSASDQVWVALGTYVPGTSPSATFTLKNQVHVIGGFYGTPGSEGNPDARDPNPATNSTVLSGDLGANGHSNIVVVATGIAYPTRLDSFTISGAVEHAIYCYDSSPALANLLVRRNGGPGSAGGAGLLLEEDSSPQVQSCTFYANAASIYGGAVWSQSGSWPAFTGCRFESNECAGNGGAVDCCTIDARPSGFARFDQCEFKGNRAVWYGGAVCHWGSSDSQWLSLRECSFSGNVAGYGGGAVFCGPASEGDWPARIVGCDFVANSANNAESSGHGGAVYVWADGAGNVRMINNRFIGNVATGNGGALWAGGPHYLQLVNCLFANNAAGNGGGAYLDGVSWQEPSEIVNCTFSGNQADDSAGTGGVHFGATGSPYSLRNNIFWGNRGNDGQGGWSYGESAQIYAASSSDRPGVTYTCIQNWDPNDFPGTGNIDDDPNSVRPEEGYYQLATGSPRIDSGGGIVPRLAPGEH